jgi:nucleoside-diphosphate-sugar epimerase
MRKSPTYGESKKKKKVLVTGATGFIGARLTHFLCSQGLEVRALCRSTSDISVFSNNPVQIFWGDVVDLPSVERAVDGCDYVFHLAGYAKNWAKNPRTFYEVNVIGTENVMIASKKAKVKKVVLTSSCVTFGISNSKPKKESDLRTADFYCDYERTKFYAEQLVSDYVRSGLPVVIVNPTRVFGPGLLTEANSVTKMIQQYLQGKWRLILADGHALGNYVFVEDIIRGHWLALKQGRPGKKYILGGENLSLNMFFRLLEEVSSRHYRMIHVPLWIALAFSKVAILLAKWFGLYPLITPDWVRVFVADWAFSSEKAHKELGYSITPFREALHKTLLWLKQSAIKPGRFYDETTLKYSRS